MKRFTTQILILPLLLIVMAVMPACIEDGITTSPDHQPAFSTDTLKMGTIFTQEGTPTYSFKVYNRHDKILSISSISIKDDAEGYFRLNVDGQSGRTFSNVEIRPNDSIYVFVATTLPANASFAPIDIERTIEFLTNGVTSEVVVAATGQNVERLRCAVVDTDTRWTADRPRQVFDSLVVAPGVTLSIDAGAKIYFHDKARLVVHGTLIADGTPEAPVEMCGDRQGNVVGDISFDLMSRQWDGVVFTHSSKASRMSHAVVRNTVDGVMVDSVTDTSAPALTLVNCRLRNADSHVLHARHSWVEAVGCEFAESGAGPVNLHGGRHRFNHCTFSNYYLFSAITGPCVNLSHLDFDSDDESGLGYMEAEFTNCIIYGSSADMLPKILDGTDVYVRNCLMRSDGTDDDHFIEVIWGEDPLFYTVRADYLFDYRLKPESPAIGMAASGFRPEHPATDFYGAQHPDVPALGAYEPWTPQVAE